MKYRDAELTGSGDAGASMWTGALPIAEELVFLIHVTDGNDGEEAEVWLTESAARELREELGRFLGL